MLWVWEDAPYSLFGAQRKQLDQIKARCRAPGWTSDQQDSVETIEGVVARVYQELGIIDSKAGSLTQASSVLLFVASFPIAAQTGFDPSGTPFALMLASFVILFVAVLLCLSVVFLHWFQFDKPVGHASDEELLELVGIRNGRTRRYRLGWLLTFFGGLTIAAGYVMSALERAPPLTQLFSIGS